VFDLPLSFVFGFYYSYGRPTFWPIIKGLELRAELARMAMVLPVLLGVSFLF